MKRKSTTQLSLGNNSLSNPYKTHIIQSHLTRTSMNAEQILLRLRGRTGDTVSGVEDASLFG